MRKILLVTSFLFSLVYWFSSVSALNICKNAWSTQFTIVSWACSGWTSTNIWQINWANDYIDFDASNNTYSNWGVYFEEPFGGGVTIRLKATTDIKTYVFGSLTDTNLLGDISDFATTPPYTIYNEPAAPTSSQMQNTVNSFGSWTISSAVSTGSWPVGWIVKVLVGVVLFFIFGGIIVYLVARFSSSTKK